MTNPFKKFQIEHLSYSSLDLWSGNPLLWCLRYLARMPSEVGPGAWRGTATGVGLANFYKTNSYESALEAAMERFDSEAKGNKDPKTEKERALVASFLDTAIKHIDHKDMPELVEAEHKIECYFDGVDIPVIGYIDFLYPDSFMELKSTLRVPTQPSDNHIGQVSLYSEVKNLDGTLVYVGPSKAISFPIGGNMKKKALDKLRRNALSLQTFLSGINDIKSALDSLPLNDADWRWNDTATETLERYQQ